MSRQLIKFLVGLFCLLVSPPGFTQRDSVSSQQTLSSVTIQAYQLKLPWIEAPTASGIVDSTLLASGHQLSPSDALNTIAGVQFESRGVDGSRRISIRGSSLRSPFGVRNIKFYWNGIPITSPDGSTGLEILDTRIVNQIEIVKGPGAITYGSGMGGVILASTTFTDNRIQIGSTIGSWGTIRHQAISEISRKKLGLKFGVIAGKTDGYREQEFNDKRQFFLLGKYRINKYHHLDWIANVYNGNWGLPGALDSAQQAENPQQAVQFAKDNNTHVQRNRVRGGLSYHFHKKKIEFQTSIYGNTTRKENPFGTSPFFNGFKDESGFGLGGRSTYAWNGRIGKVVVKPIVGIEYQFDRNDLNESPIGNQSQPISAIRTTASSVIGFFDLRTSYKGCLLTLGASYNRLTYHQKSIGDTSINQPEVDGERAFQPFFTPRISLLKTITSSLSVFGIYSHGYNPPTVWDLEIENNILNQQLKPEIGTNYELGLKWSFRKKLRIQLNGFHLSTRNAIISQQLASLDFALSNSGVTQQNGFELSADFSTSFAKKWNWDAHLSYTFSDYKFSHYIDDGEDFSGKHFPGIPNHRMVVQTTIQSPIGIFLSLRGLYQGPTFINSENTSEHPSYLLANAKLSYQKRIGPIGIEAFILCDNLLDSTYSSFIQLNGFGGRFYNPSPTRSYYGSLRLSYHF